MALDSRLLALLACPICKGSLAVEGDDEGLLCARCSKVFPVREEIPVMLAEEAIPLREWANGKREMPPAASRL